MMRRLALPLALATLLVACHLGDAVRYQEEASFPGLYDSLKRFDHAVILFADGEGRFLDTVFQGRVDAPSRLQNLPVDNWDGGLAVIRFYGYLDGKEVYAVEKRYDGATGRTVSTLLLKTPDARLALPVRGLTLFAGDSLPLPPVTVTPVHLADTTVTWTSADPAVARVASGVLQGLREGATHLTARLAADSSKTLSLLVRVDVDLRTPERIVVAPETLFVAAGGAPSRAAAKAQPASAEGAVRWRTDDPTLAAVETDGTVRGLRPGLTRLRAASTARASVEGSAFVLVTDSVPVQSVRFRKDSTLLYLGGAAESLLVDIEPPAADPAVRYTALAPGIVAVQDGRLDAVAEGTTSLIVSSRRRPAVVDTLAVRVVRAPRVDSLRITPRTLTLYVGGADQRLEVRVYPPASPDGIRFLSANPALADVDAGGVVAPRAPGHVRLHAISAADSLVRDSLEVRLLVDAPRVDLGADTVLKVGDTLAVRPQVAPQAYGLETLYKWDLDGDLAWDDSAAAVRTVSRRFAAEGVVTVRVLVRDTEGNETIARKLVRVVTGPVVRIHAPADRSHVREARIPVRWSVDGIAQDSLLFETLSEGPNLLTRSVPDPRGGFATATLLVTLDTTDPGTPDVTGPPLAGTPFPAWRIAASGTGAGIFRYALDGAPLGAAAETRDTVFVPAEALAEGPHTVEAQERDLAGNWSPVRRHTLRVDLTPPAPPSLQIEPARVTRVLTPTFRWQGGGGGSGLFQFRLGEGAFGTPATEVAFTPMSALAEGEHVFGVRERDSAGHWSQVAALTVTLDITPPAAPRLAGPSPTGAAPRWTWSSGGGGSGDYRYKVGGNGNPADGGVETRALEHVLTGAVPGTTYTLHLQERDAAGNWSDFASHPIVHDPTRPAITIRSPQASGTYRTRLATVDIAGTASKPEGGTPIRSLTYTLDGVAGTLPTQLAADGSWAIRSLPLENDKTLEFKATVTDGSGNIGEAILFLAMDSTPPPPPVFTAQPPAVVNAADTRTSLSWTWRHAGALTDSFVVSLNGAEVSRQTATTFTVDNLADGAYALQLLALDLAGNLSPPVSAATVTVDRAAPAPPSPTATSPTRDNTPTWTWTSPGGGSFEYRLALGAAPTGTGIALTGSTFTPEAALADGAWYFQVRARDVSGNWSTWSPSSIVVVNATAPAAPVVVRNAAASNAPRWTWSGGGGGNGTYRYRWSGAGSYLGEGTAMEYAPTGLSEQVYTLCVAERDTVGYGVEDCEAITVDRTPPQLAGYSVAEGFITNRSQITIRFTRDGAPDSLSCDLTDGASTVCRKAVSDAAGNAATATRTVWYRSNVVFVKAGQTGTRGGTSWEDAYAEIGTALAAIEGRTGRVEVWVAEGTYPNFIVNRSSTSIIGGFSASGNPIAVEFRNPLIRVSRIRADENGSIIRISGLDPSICRDVILDGFHIRGEIGQAVGINSSDNITIRKFWIEENRNEAGGAGLVSLSSGSSVFDSVFIRDNYLPGYSSIYQTNRANLSLLYSEVSNNELSSPWASAGILNENGGRTTIRFTKLALNEGGNTPGAGQPFYQAYLHGGESIEVENSTIQNLRNGIYPPENSSLVIWGPGNVAP